jgi:hypothetical protein
LLPPKTPRIRRRVHQHYNTRNDARKQANDLFPRDRLNARKGLLSPTLSSRGGEGDISVAVLRLGHR